MHLAPSSPSAVGLVQVASCERTILPSGEAAAEVKRILGQQQRFEAAMRVVNLGSRTGVKPKRKSTGELICACVCFQNVDSCWDWVFSAC